MASTEALEVVADRRRALRSGVAAVGRGGLEPERRRLALHAGRRPRLRLHRRRRQMAGELAGPAARPEARLDQHGAGDQGAAAQRPRHRTAEALHRRGARRPARSPASMPRSRDGRSTCRWVSTISTRSRAGTSIEVKDAAVPPPAGITAASDRTGGPAQACSLRPAADAAWSGRRSWPISRCASPAAPGSPRTRRERSSGFVLGREGRVATSLGPVVADSEAIALALIARAAASAPGPFIIDVPAGPSCGPCVA